MERGLETPGGVHEEKLSYDALGNLTKVMRRNVNVSTKQAFSRFEDWKTKKSALLIIRLINRPPGVSMDIANFSGRIFRVDASLGRVFVIEGTPTSGEQEIVFDLAGASFAIAPNIADS